MRHVGKSLILVAILGSIVGVSQAQPGFPPEFQPTAAPTLTLAGDGSLWAAWVAEFGADSEIVTSRWTGRSWEPAEIVFENPGWWDRSPSLTTDADGVLWLAWASSTATDNRLYLSRWTDRGWSVPQRVPAWETAPNQEPVLAPAPEGGLWLAWVGFDGRDDDIYAAYWDGMSWSEPQRISADDGDPEAYDTQPRLAVGPDGHVWVAWVGYEKFLDDEIFVAQWDGQRWGGEQQVSTDDDTAKAYPSLAVADDGTVWLAWHGPAAMDPNDNRRIHVARWSRPAGWSAETVVSSPRRSGVSEERPSLSLDAEGRPHVIWHVDGGIRGLGYTVFDGAGWASPRWVVEDVVVDSVLALEENTPLIVWLPEGKPSSMPFERQMPDDSRELLPFFETPVQPLAVAQIVENRHVALGDSITWGLYDDPSTGQPVGDYPARLESMIDARVIDSEVINAGKPSERTVGGEIRLKDEILPVYHPQFVEIMEGTNDISNSRPPNDIMLNLKEMDRACLRSGARSVMSTVIPRLDGGDLYNKTAKLNLFIAQLAADRAIPLTDNWAAFHDYGDWQSLYIDHLHPNSIGMQILADSFYQTLIDYGLLVDDSLPPTAEIVSLPSQSECGGVQVAWTGDDAGGSGIVSFDVQVQDNGGPWSNWLVETPEYSGTYVGATFGHTLGFRVRARDEVGNIGEYSDTATTQIVDTTPPHDVGVASLPPIQTSPFTVSWWAHDSCSTAATYDVEYRVGNGPWVRWLSRTPETSQSFNVGSPQCGQSYSFQVRAYDAANNRSLWSAAMPTTLACHAASGSVLTVRETPIFNALLSADPAELGTDPSDKSGAYALYFSSAGNYDISVARDGFGTLPARQGVAVTGHVTGVNFYLPPSDDQVDNGGFEEAGWGNWQRTGSIPPTVTTTAHTGAGAARLAPGSGDSRLSQSPALPIGLVDPTLSMMVRLADSGEATSTLVVRISGATTIEDDLVVSSSDWTHVWYDVSAFAGQTVNLTLSVTDDPSVIVDEISLGSGKPGVHSVYLPMVAAND